LRGEEEFTAGIVEGRVLFGADGAKIFAGKSVLLSGTEIACAGLKTGHYKS
jgi:hypothetical protein